MSVSAGQVDAIARAVAQLEPDTRAELAAAAPSLIDAASSSSVEWFERHVREVARRLEADDGLRQAERVRKARFLRRWTDRETGLCHTHVALDPEADARLSAMLDAAVAAEKAKPEVETRTFDQLRADAFVSLATGARTSGHRPGEISVLIDHETYLGHLHEHSVCETADGNPLTPDAVRRIACDADLIPIVLGADGNVLDHGRTRRIASANQRRALRSMYRTCGHPGCAVRFGDCEIHHVIEWIKQRGPTDLDNLLPLCHTHHHAIHEGGWKLTLQPGRIITLHRPDGTLAFHGTTTDATPTRNHSGMNTMSTPHTSHADRSPHRSTAEGGARRRRRPPPTSESSSGKSAPQARCGLVADSRLP